MAASGRSTTVTPTEIQNRTRSIWIPAPLFVEVAAGPSLVGVIGAIGASAWALDASVAEGVVASVVLPADVAAGSVVAKVYWTVNDTNSGNVVWTMYGRLNAPGAGNINADIVGPATGAAPGVARRTVSTTVSSDFFGSATEAAGSYSNVYVERTATDGADTYAADAYFLGVLLEYLADS